MKEYIAELVKIGVSYHDALIIVSNIAMKAFEEGEYNINYSEQEGFSSNKTFSEWFNMELTK